jgi:hypothetical protein
VKAPRPAPAALTVSDRTCEAVFGVNWRTLRTFLQQRHIAYQKIGRRPVVRVDVVLAALDPSAAPAAVTEATIIELAAGRGRR